METPMTATPQQAIATPDPAVTFTEAPYSGNVRARMRGYDWQFTIRDSKYDKFISRANGLMDWLDQHAEKVNIEPPAKAAPVAPAASNAPQSPTTQPQPAGIQSIKIVKMSVTPRADGKSDVKFFEAGHQYPDLYATRTPAELAALLKATGDWKEDHFKAAAEYNVMMLIDYKLSEKKNSKGNPYKDIVTISAA